MEVKRTCPLGHTCEKAVDGHIERCMWYTQLRGQDPQTGQDVDRWECAIAWQPILMIEMSGQVRSGVVATESLRNNMDKRQGQALEVISGLQISGD